MRRLICGILLSFIYYPALAQEVVEPFFDINGFVETRLGFRTQHDPNEKDASIAEARLQIEAEKDFDDFTFTAVIDFVADPISGEYTIDLNTGEGFADLRQFNIDFSPLDYADVKIGRQIITWGTGDLLFINDLFAKDWNSFLIGRDEEYLKAPTDALKASLFFDAVNFNLVYTPKFQADRFIDGTRISYFDASTNASTGRHSPLVVQQPNRFFSDDEISIRAYRSLGSIEAALYYYNGFWKSPAGIDATSDQATFPELSVYGASLRGPLFGGIANIETGYYESNRDAATDALSRNGELRFLVGYEQEIASELTASAQYYLEHKLDYGNYIDSLTDASFVDDQNHHVITLRLTQLLLQQDLELSLFNFYSPSDKDGYLRLDSSYKFSDETKIEAGANIFYGDEKHTFYSQFNDNSNIYAAIRYSF